MGGAIAALYVICAPLALLIAGVFFLVIFVKRTSDWYDENKNK